MSVIFDANAKVTPGNELGWTLLSSRTGKNKCPWASFIFISCPESTCDKGNFYNFRLPLRLCVIYQGATGTCQRTSPARVCSENLRRGFCHRAWFTVKFMPPLWERTSHYITASQELIVQPTMASGFWKSSCLSFPNAVHHHKGFKFASLQLLTVNKP